MLLFLLLSTSHAVTLDEAFQSALQKNEIVGSSREDVVQAEESVTEAESAIYPNLTFNALHVIQPLPGDPIARQFAPETQTTTNLTLTQPLFRGFREFAVRRMRKKTLSAEQQKRVGALTELYRQVATSYLEVLAIEQDLKNLNEQRVLHTARIKELNARTRTGQSQPTDALSAQADEAAVQAEISLVEAKLQAARENLFFLTSIPADSKLKDNESKAGETPELRKLEAYLSAVEDRPDVRSARERVSAASEEISVARGGHWPTLDFIGNYYFQRPGFLSDLRWDAQFKLVFPIFEGGLRFSETRAAASRHRESELELHRLRRQANTEIRTLHQNLALRVNQLIALKRSTDLAEKTYQITQRDYRRGLYRNIDVQVALNGFRISRRTYDQARYQARLDLIRLETAANILPASITKEQ